MEPPASPGEANVEAELNALFQTDALDWMDDVNSDADAGDKPELEANLLGWLENVENDP